jgi:hypothetical protein
MVARIRYSVAEQSRGWVMLCAVYTMLMKIRSASFLVKITEKITVEKSVFRFSLCYSFFLCSLRRF